MAPLTRQSQARKRAYRSNNLKLHPDQSSSTDQLDEEQDHGSDVSDWSSVTHKYPKRPRQHQGPTASNLISKKGRAPLNRERFHLTASEFQLGVMPIVDRENQHRCFSIKKENFRWQELPYHIILQIFEYASYPLMSDDFVPTASVGWLIRCLRLCKSFADPILSVLYCSPPLYPPERARRLLEHLKSQNKAALYDYRAKVKYLDIEGWNNSIRRRAGRDPIDLGDLICYTPQIRGVRIHLMTDLPINHKTPSRTGPKALYSQSIFAALQSKQIRLKEWIWNALMIGKRFCGSKLVDVHKTSSFQSLQDLTFINYDATSSSEGELAMALNALPCLKRLSFKASNILNARLLPLLPPHLERLEIMNCSELRSDIFTAFLTEHGEYILELLLDHNKSLNLSFLASLASSCPRIQELRINLRFYNTHFTFQNSEPKFDCLLLAHERPAWPQTLRRLELFHLRKWNLETAEVFFSSLVDSALQLSSLRYLDIKASLGESGWRDRVHFRDKWVARLQHTFLRLSPEPRPFRRRCQEKLLENRTVRSKDSLVRGRGLSPLPESFHGRDITRKYPPKPNHRESHVNVRGRYSSGENSLMLMIE